MGSTNRTFVRLTAVGNPNKSRGANTFPYENIGRECWGQNLQAMLKTITIWRVIPFVWVNIKWHYVIPHVKSIYSEQNDKDSRLCVTLKVNVSNKITSQGINKWKCEQKWNGSQKPLEKKFKKRGGSNSSKLVFLADLCLNNSVKIAFDQSVGCTIFSSTHLPLYVCPCKKCIWIQYGYVRVWTIWMDGWMDR